MTVRDANQSERTEKELQRSTQALRIYERIVENSPDPLIIVDRDYRFRMANRAYLDFHHIELNHVLKQTMADALGKDLFESQLRERLDRAFRGETVSFAAWTDYPGLGPRYMDVRYFPLLTDGRVEIVAILLRDQTERKRAEQEHERLLAQFQLTGETAGCAPRARKAGRSLRRSGRALGRCRGRR